MDGVVDFTDLGALTPQLQSPGPITTGNVKPTDWDLLAIMMGGAGQALAAPGTWQAGLGGLASGLGQSAKMAQAARQQRRERSAQWEWLRDILSGGATPQGIPGLTSFKVSPKGEMTLGVTPERDTWDNVFGLEPLTLGGLEGSTAPRQAGGGEMRPFSEALAGR